MDAIAPVTALDGAFVDEELDDVVAPVDVESVLTTVQRERVGGEYRRGGQEGVGEPVHEFIIAVGQPNSLLLKKNIIV